MASVWKRLQRVGKKASKFQFVASYQELVLECTKKWQPDKLRVVWTRRNRRMCSKLHSWQPGIKNPYRGMVVWPVPENIDISVTLFKEANAEEFEDKEWTFVIEGENKGHRKVLASADINLKRFASPTPTQTDLTLNLKPLSVKVVEATLKLSLSCVFVREGKATDEDMQSLASLMSVKPTDIGNLDDFNESDEEEDRKSVTATIVPHTLTRPNRPAPPPPDQRHSAGASITASVHSRPPLPIAPRPSPRRSRHPLAAGPVQSDTQPSPGPSPQPSPRSKHKKPSIPAPPEASAVADSPASSQTAVDKPSAPPGVHRPPDHLIPASTSPPSSVVSTYYREPPKSTSNFPSDSPKSLLQTTSSQMPHVAVSTHKSISTPSHLPIPKHPSSQKPAVSSAQPSLTWVISQPPSLPRIFQSGSTKAPASHQRSPTDVQTSADSASLLGHVFKPQVVKPVARPTSPSPLSAEASPLPSAPPLGLWLDSAPSGGEVAPVPLLSSPDLDSLCDPETPVSSAGLSLSASSLSKPGLISSLRTVTPPSAPPAQTGPAFSLPRVDEETATSPQKNHTAEKSRISDPPVLDLKTGKEKSKGKISPALSRSELIIAPPPPWPFSSTSELSSTSVVAAFITPKQPRAEGKTDLKMSASNPFRSDLTEAEFGANEPLSWGQKSGGFSMEEENSIKRCPPCLEQKTCEKTDGEKPSVTEQVAMVTVRDKQEEEERRKLEEKQEKQEDQLCRKEFNQSDEDKMRRAAPFLLKLSHAPSNEKTQLSAPHYPLLAESGITAEQPPAQTPDRQMSGPSTVKPSSAPDECLSSPSPSQSNIDKPEMKIGLAAQIKAVTVEVLTPLTPPQTPSEAEVPLWKMLEQRNNETVSAKESAKPLCRGLHKEAEVDTHEREQLQTMKDSVPQVPQPSSPSPPGEPGEPTQPSGEQTALELESDLQEAKEPQQEEVNDPADKLAESLVISEEPACEAEQQLWAAVEETTAETGGLESTESPKQEQKKEEGIVGGAQTCAHTEEDVSAAEQQEVSSPGFMSAVVGVLYRGYETVASLLHTSKADQLQASPEQELLLTDNEDQPCLYGDDEPVCAADVGMSPPTVPPETTEQMLSEEERSETHLSTQPQGTSGLTFVESLRQAAIEQEKNREQVEDNTDEGKTGMKENHKEESEEEERNKEETFRTDDEERKEKMETNEAKIQTEEEENQKEEEKGKRTALEAEMNSEERRKSPSKLPKVSQCFQTDEIAFDELMQSRNEPLSSVTPHLSLAGPEARTQRPAQRAGSRPKDGSIPVWLREDEEEQVEYERGQEDLGSVWLAELYMDVGAGE
ncbi:hypothetical protein OJAV_G00142480 [Oryzias javanicus]|uniref:C2 NT-type domain-containing protein n=1 Tax=Oryzias javanicus TaxID=123683 RepID=A0A3S2MBS0_ORYJA|nr:hypothetical protein OJAV_G00142480 [Oryzias javanicus]